MLNNQNKNRSLDQEKISISPPAPPSDVEIEDKPKSDLETQASDEYKNSDFDSAAETYSEAIKEQVNSKEQAKLLNLKANSLRDAGKTSEAIDAYNQAISLDLQLVVAYVNLANLYVAEDNKSKAEEVVDKGLKANPDNRDLLLTKQSLQIQDSGSESSELPERG